MSEEEKEFKADHFENIEELVKTCKMWVTDDDYDAYCRFFDMGAMEEILNLISTLQKELDKKDKVIEEIKSKLQKHINFCEQESRGHLENKVCHISLKFEKNLLEEVEKVGGEDE